MKEEILRLENVTKKENDFILLDKFHLHIFKGEVMGLLTLNATGVNVFSEVLCNHVPVDFGRIYLNDQLIDTDELKRTNRNKVFNIESQTSLSLNLTVADNIFVIKNGFKKYAINDRILFRQAEMLFKEFNMSIDPREIAANLTPLECIMVELVKAYAFGAKIIILNNLTNYLGLVDLEALNKTMLLFKNKGISFLFIDTYLDVLFKFSDRLTIMRDGKNIRTLKQNEFDERKVISLFSDRIFETIKERPEKKNQPVVLEFRNVSAEYLNNISFKVHKGEIVHVLDARGKSIVDIYSILNTAYQVYSGNVFINDQIYKCHRLSMVIKRGVGFIFGNPLENMLFKHMSVLENLSFMMPKKINRFRLKSGMKKSIIQEFYKRLGKDIYSNDISELDTASLLKLAYYKWFLYSPKLLVCLMPFIGLDIYMRKLTIDLMNEIAAKGTSILIMTSNLSEVHIACDRMLLIENGRIIEEYEKGDINQEYINTLLENTSQNI